MLILSKALRVDLQVLRILSQQESIGLNEIVREVRRRTKDEQVEYSEKMLRDPKQIFPLTSRQRLIKRINGFLVKNGFMNFTTFEKSSRRSKLGRKKSYFLTEGGKGLLEKCDSLDNWLRAYPNISYQRKILRDL